MRFDRVEPRSHRPPRLVLRERILSRDASNGADGDGERKRRKDYGSARCYSQEYWSRTEVRHLGPGDNKTDERAGVPLPCGPKTDRNSRSSLLIDSAIESSPSRSSYILFLLVYGIFFSFQKKRQTKNCISSHPRLSSLLFSKKVDRDLSTKSYAWINIG